MKGSEVTMADVKSAVEQELKAAGLEFDEKVGEAVIAYTTMAAPPADEFNAQRLHDVYAWAKGFFEIEEEGE